jgi:tetratricopeptide (TPR) repeat protein
MREVSSRLAAAIAGSVFRVSLPATPRSGSGSVDPEAFRLTLLGWHHLLALGDTPGAHELFLQAIRLDPMHARAWSGLSSTWAAATTNGRIPFEEGRILADAAASRALALDSLEGTAWANLGMMRALEARSLDVGEPLFRRAIAVEPSNAEVYMIYAAALRFAWQWERAGDLLNIARELDPLSAFYPELAGNGNLCADRPEEALRWYRIAATLDDRDRNVHIGTARALARLGRWEEAIAQLRLLALARGDTALAALDHDAHGETGYWRLKHREGERFLQARLTESRAAWRAPYLLGVAEIGAGHLDRGLTLLEGEVRAGSRMVYKLPCNQEIDEVRSLPRFQRLLAAAGSLPLRR